jgi:hypothetical protein
MTGATRKIGFLMGIAFIAVPNAVRGYTPAKDSSKGSLWGLTRSKPLKLGSIEYEEVRSESPEPGQGGRNEAR